MAIIYGVRLVGAMAGQITNNIIHVRNEDGFVYTKQQFLDNLFTRFTGQLVFVQCTQFTWTSMDIWKWYVEDDPHHIVPISQSGQGTDSFQFANPLAAVFQKRTAVGGKVGRGRFYLPAPPATAVNLGKWNQNYLNALGNVRTAINAWLTGEHPLAHINLVLVPKHAEGEEFKDLTDFRPRDYPGTQVRRNFLRGR